MTKVVMLCRDVAETFVKYLHILPKGNNSYK